MEKIKEYKYIILLVLVILGFALFLLPNSVEAFVVEYEYSTYDAPGFFSGIWHGLLSPYSLIARWFASDIVMYATPNTGWFYDFGFLLGAVGSIPVGWLAAIISTIGHIFF